MKKVNKILSKKLCIILIFNILVENKRQFIILLMHNLKTNFDKFNGITKSFFSNRINGFDNFQSYPRNPKMSDCQIIALSLTDESIGIDSENYFFGKLKSLFSQLCDQFMLKRNYAKSNLGISVRILTKISGVTVLQYFNFLNNKPLNQLKYALAA